MTNPILPTVTSPSAAVSAQQISTALAKPNNRFEYYYFKMHTHGATTRALLTISGAEWKDIYPGDWFTHDKQLTTFGTLPILYEISPATELGQPEIVVEYAEALNIELRLARKFNLLGANAFEESQITALFSNTRAIMHRHEDAYFTHSAFRTQDRDTFISTKLAQWIKSHEEWLIKNGSNGHYVGDKTTLADIKTAVALDSLLNQQYEFIGFGELMKKAINEEKTPNLWRVREKVLKDFPVYGEFLKSEQYGAITVETKAFFDHEYSTL